MTAQAPDTFGVDIFLDPATDDADPLWSEVSGVALVNQDLRLRLQTDQLLYNGADLAASYQGRIKRVVLKDRRIDSADVIVTEDGTGPLRTLTIAINCKTALGPFSLVFRLDPSQLAGAQLKLIQDQ